MIFCGLVNVNSWAEQASTCVKISTSEEVMVLMYHTHAHAWLLPTAMLLWFRHCPFAFVLLFLPLQSFCEPQTLLFTNLNFAWEIVGFEFQCYRGLLSSFYLISSSTSMLILILSGSSTSWAALIWQHSSLSWLNTQEPLHCAVPWPWCTVQSWMPAGFVLWLACLRAASIHVSLEIHVCHFHRKASFNCV